jgi:hypothetical protein
MVESLWGRILARPREIGARRRSASDRTFVDAWVKHQAQQYLSRRQGFTRPENLLRGQRP